MRKRPSRRAVLTGVAAAVAVTVVAAALAFARAHRSAGSHGSTYAEPAVTAAFRARSYPAGGVAALDVRTRGRIALQLFRAGPEARRARSDDALAGVAVAPPATVRGGAVARLRLGAWPSGLYFARLRARDGRIGFAPFVVRPRRLGTARVAVVLPTNTWQAYNFRDGATWYANDSVHTVDLTRPFLDRGVPPHFRAYDSGFVHWLAHSGHAADVLSDDDLDRVRSGDVLARLYDLVVFPGHEEYVTPHMYDVVARYRDLGGNLAFLSSNNFFYRVTRSGDVLHGRDRWRDLGRPEERLIGAQYVDWNHDRWPNRPYTVVGARRAPWLFAESGLRNGDRFGVYGIEIDARGPGSPPGTQVLAESRDIFGAGKSAQMTYYETARGAKVFDAGVINFGGSAQQPVASRLLEALWARLSRP